MFDFALLGSGLSAYYLCAKLTSAGYSVLWLQDKCQSTLNNKKYSKKTNESKKAINSEKNSAPYLVLNHASVRRMKSLGIESSLTSCEQLHSYELYYQSKKCAKLTHKDWNIPYLGVNISVPTLVNLLKDSIKKDLLCQLALNKENSDRDFENFDIEFDDDKVSVHLSDQIHQARYFIFADGQNSKAYQFLKEDQKPLCQSQGQSLSLTLNTLNSKAYSNRSIQYLSPDATVGIISKGQAKLTVVFTAADCVVNSWKNLTLEELLIKISCTSVLSLEAFAPGDLKQKIKDIPSRSLHSYHLKNPLKRNFGVFGLAARALHPAAAQGFNNIVYEIELFLNYWKKNKDADSNWREAFNRQIDLRYTQSSNQIDFLINPSKKLLLPFLPVELLTKSLMPFQVR